MTTKNMPLEWLLALETDRKRSIMVLLCNTQLEVLCSYQILINIMMIRNFHNRHKMPRGPSKRILLLWGRKLKVRIRIRIWKMLGRDNLLSPCNLDKSNFLQSLSKLRWLLDLRIAMIIPKFMNLGEKAKNHRNLSLHLALAIHNI